MFAAAFVNSHSRLMEYLPPFLAITKSLKRYEGPIRSAEDIKDLDGLCSLLVYFFDNIL